jgi:hypothetical protein
VTHLNGASIPIHCISVNGSPSFRRGSQYRSVFFGSLARLHALAKMGGRVPPAPPALTNRGCQGREYTRDTRETRRIPASTEHLQGGRHCGGRHCGGRRYGVCGGMGGVRLHDHRMREPGRRRAPKSGSGLHPDQGDAKIAKMARPNKTATGGESVSDAPGSMARSRTGEGMSCQT